MNQFVDFINEKIASDNAMMQGQDFNVMVLYQQYIDWLINERFRRCTVSELLFQLQVINAYQLHYATLGFEGKLQSVPYLVANNESYVDDKQVHRDIVTVYLQLKSQASQYYKHKQRINIAVGIVMITLMGVLIDYLTHIPPPGPPFAGALTVITIFAGAIAIGFELWGSSSRRESSYIKALDQVKPQAALIKPMAKIEDNGFGQAFHATTKVLLFNEWGCDYVGHGEFYNTSIKLNDLAGELKSVAPQPTAMKGQNL